MAYISYIEDKTQVMNCGFKTKSQQKAKLSYRQSWRKKGDDYSTKLAQ